MPSGSCYCGNITVSFTGDPIAKGLCHCMDCRKQTGSTHTTNLIIPAANFTHTGTPKFVHKTSSNRGDTSIRNYFCGDCGSPLWGVGSFGENVVLRAGILDEPEGVLEELKPGVELFSERRVGWLGKVEDAQSMEGMGGLGGKKTEE